MTTQSQPMSQKTMVKKRLHTQEVLRLTSSQGKQLEVAKGVLWVTQEGDPQDYLLHAGERLIFERRGLALVQALTEAAYCLSQN